MPRGRRAPLFCSRSRNIVTAAVILDFGFCDLAGKENPTQGGRRGGGRYNIAVPVIK
jgi:hypothetical protein